MKRPLCLVFTLCAVSLVHGDETIRSWQQTLKEQGFYYGTVTGERSAETTAAIRRYQIRNGLQVTGDVNDETQRSLSSSSNSVAAASRRSSQPAAPQPKNIRPDAIPRLSQSSPSPSFNEKARPLATNPFYSASYYQSAPPRVNRRTIAGAQYQLMRHGFYRGRIDGSNGPETAFGVGTFQSSAGRPTTGPLDTQSLDALGLSDMSAANVAPAPGQGGTWIPVRKYKHGKWKVKWKKYHRGSGNQYADEDQKAYRGHRWQDHYNDD